MQNVGNEILAELCHHLGIINELDGVVDNTIVRSTYMPYITSQFMVRASGIQWHLGWPCRRGTSW